MSAPRTSQPEKWTVGEITAAMISRYAAAVGDMNPIYHDPAAAKAAGYADVVAPPNFLSAIIGALTGVAEDQLQQDGLDAARIPEPLRGLRLMGGGQELTLHNPVCAGARVTATREILECRQKPSAQGTLKILTARTHYADQDGALLVTSVEQLLALEVM